ncbi:Retinol dehydrogenase 12 [Habropoda laboriosa]|uniref:Retinol dehydrogenase 12 n=1 Tax=Habropoda laboriosa TaxID=597456 RepID=A0A0L7R851_9HYME|nr:PREDICTED: retinol dehydrogenase 12-like [Habropoda laboriosa]KOC67024.1 Retinol dehydrogenase 12 [Habropoda laboriosa]
MLFIGSVCAIIASGFVYRNFRESCSLMIDRVLCDTKFTLIAIRETIYDLINVKNNKNDCSTQTGRVAIVTGGSRGIGIEVVKTFLQLDMEVIIACRTPSAGEKAILQIRESGVNTGQAKVYKLDNASLESVKQFAAEIKKDYTQIHILVNNAGVMFCPYAETVDGFEQQWGVNYLSHFLLTALLLPLLKAGGLPQQSSRIVNVTSCAHLLGKINFNDINNKRKFITGYAYAQSKLAQETFTKRLQSLLQEKQYNVQVYSVHPGVVFTELFTHTYVWKFKSFFQCFFKTPKQGAISIAYAAVNKAVENLGGIYINNCRPSQVHPDALNLSIQNKLLELSLQQVQLNDFFQHVQ